MISIPQRMTQHVTDMEITFAPLGRPTMSKTINCRLRPEDKSYSITNLQSHTLYLLRILYKNEVSTKFVETWPGAPLKVQDLELKLDCEPKRPCIFATWRYNDTSDTEFQVQYYPVDEQNRKDIHKFTHSFNVTKKNFISHPTTHVVGSTVEFVVRGVTEFQMSEAVHAKITLPEGAPSDYPRNLQVHSNTVDMFVSVTWDSPKWETLNGKFVQNEIICHTKNRLSFILIPNITEHEIQIQKHVLTKEMFCKVRYWTGVGPGPWSPLVPIDYVHTDADPPTDLQAIRISECCMKITWRWKPEFATTYSKFVIRSSVKDDNETESITDTVYPTSVAYIENLVGKTKYVIQVKSILKTSKQSPWSHGVIPKIYSELWPTHSVHYPKCFMSSFRAVTLQWIFPYHVKNLSHFRINFTGATNYRSKDGRILRKIRDEREDSLLLVHGMQEYTAIIENLEPNTLYSFDIEPILALDLPVWTVSTRTLCQTKTEAPEMVPVPKIARVDKDELIIHVLLEPPSFEHGSVELYWLVIVSNDQLLENFGSSDVTVIDMSPQSRLMIEASLLSRDNHSELSSKQLHFIIVELNVTLLTSNYMLGQVFTFPLGCTRPDSKLPLKRMLIKGADYRTAFVACVKSNLKKETIRKLCSISSWSEIINPEYSRPFPMPKHDNKYNITNETNTDNSIFVGIILSSLLVPLVLISVLIFTRQMIRKRNANFISFQPCVKMRRSSQDYYPTSANEMKENLVNPLMSSANIGSSYSAHNPDSLELKRHHISSTPDLLVKSSPSSSYKFVDRSFVNSCDHANSLHKVPIALLHDYISNLKANENRGFSVEFESIDHSNEFTWEHSNKVGNKFKNRYANVVAYDHSRVVLQKISNGNSDTHGEDGNVTDYINANYINGYRKQNAYIATQGPVPETVGDFWRMVWEQRTAVVVMLTLLIERCRIKCEQYWPKGNKGAQCTFGGIVVIVNTVLELSYFICRSFLIQKIGSAEKREIRHFQFTAWPDHGVPQCTMPFLMFVNKIKQEISFDSGPIIVHCSAGVGRTGDFIVVDSMLEQIKHEKYVDIYSYVTHIRGQRNYMVQTEEQYVFIHDVILDYLQSVNTEVTKQQLFSHVEKLNKIEVEKSGFIQVSGFQQEYRRLLRWSSFFSHITPSTKSECSTKSSDSIAGQQDLFTVNYETALSNINLSKNRNPLCLPLDSSRVVLCPIRAVEGSDYINASWIDGYRSRKTYIATQCPIKETTEDFWRMLWEHDCGIVITLSELEKSSQYWPNNRSGRYQFFVVDPVAEYAMSHFTLREFNLTDARDGQTRVLRQFQFIEWIEEMPIPVSTEDLLELITQVQKTREQFGQKDPITVHCDFGSSRTGIFIALSILVEKLIEESSFNVFEVFKLLKWQRPSLIESEEQYQFCFAALLEYLTLYSDDSTLC